MRFKVGDLITPKIDYTGSEWTNEMMCNNSYKLRFGAASRVKSINDTTMEIVGEKGTYTPERFELAKSIIIHQILSEI